MLRLSILRRTVTIRHYQPKTNLWKNYPITHISFTRSYSDLNTKPITDLKLEPKLESSKSENPDDDDTILFLIICLWLFLFAKKMSGS